jgi:hypothetical protein
VTPESVEKLKKGMSLSLLEHHLGSDPSEQHEQTYWYVGPATRARFEVVDGAVTDVIEVTENSDKRESDIAMQKWIAAFLAVVAVITIFFLARAVLTRVVLDDTGLKYNGRHISWDAMKDLDIQEYKDRGWVDLVYDEDKVIRLDSYHIARFKEIITEICDRKGSSSPFADKPATAQAPEGTNTESENS